MKGNGLLACIEGQKKNKEEEREKEGVERGEGEEIVGERGRKA